MQRSLPTRVADFGPPDSCLPACRQARRFARAVARRDARLGPSTRVAARRRWGLPLTRWRIGHPLGSADAARRTLLPVAYLTGLSPLQPKIDIAGSVPFPLERETVTVEYPADVRLGLRETKEEFAGELKMLAAVKLYELGKISSGKAAALAGMDRVSFLVSLGRYRVSVFNNTPEELEREVAEAKAGAG